MSRRRAWVVAILVGVVAAIATAFVPHPIRLQGVGIGDIGLPLAGLELFERGHSPYALKLRGSEPTMYPFTTMVVLWPLRLVPLQLAAPLFFGIASALLAYAIGSAGKPWHFLIFLSPSYWSALESVQWAPIFAAALLMPALLPFAVVKPHLGLVLLAAGRWRRIHFACATVLVALTFALYPGWVHDWFSRGNFNTFNGRSPIMVLPGFLLFATAVALPSASARLLGAMSIVLQRYFYDQLPLFLLPSSWLRMLVLLGTSWTAAALSFAAGWSQLGSGVQHPRAWNAVIVGFFLPALVMVLIDWRAARRGTFGRVPREGRG